MHIIPIGKGSTYMASYLAGRGHEVHSILPEDQILTHEGWENFWFGRETDFLTKCNEVTAGQVTVLVDDSPESGAVLGMLQTLLQKDIPSKIQVLLYLKGQDTSMEGQIIEKVLFGVLSNKARAGNFDLIVVREEEMARIYGDIWAVGIDTRYYEIVAEILEIWDSLQNFTPSIVRSNVKDDMAFFSDRETFAKTMTFMAYDVDGEKIKSLPFFLLDNPQFFTYFINTAAEDNISLVAQKFTKLTQLSAEQKVQVNFYTLPTSASGKKIILRLGIIKTTAAN